MKQWNALSEVSCLWKPEATNCCTLASPGWFQGARIACVSSNDIPFTYMRVSIYINIPYIIHTTMLFCRLCMPIPCRNYALQEMAAGRTGDDSEKIVWEIVGLLVLNSCTSSLIVQFVWSDAQMVCVHESSATNTPWLQVLLDRPSNVPRANRSCGVKIMPSCSILTFV